MGKLLSDGDPLDMAEVVRVRQIVAEKFQIARTKAISFGNLEMVSRNAECLPRLDYELQTMFLELRTWLLAGKHEASWITRSTPATWWDHVKKDLAPAWFTRRWPVKYDEERIRVRGDIHVCPHANIAWPDGEQHLNFIAYTQDGDPVGSQQTDSFVAIEHDYLRGPC